MNGLILPSQTRSTSRLYFADGHRLNERGNETVVEEPTRTGADETSERVYLSSGVEQDLRNRLNRIEGHVGGIRRMLDEREDCEHLLVQIIAVKAALNQVAIKLLDEHMSMCVATYVSTDDTEALKRFTEALGIVLKRT